MTKTIQREKHTFPIVGAYGVARVEATNYGRGKTGWAVELISLDDHLLTQELSLTREEAISLAGAWQRKALLGRLDGALAS